MLWSYTLCSNCEVVSLSGIFGNGDPRNPGTRIPGIREDLGTCIVTGTGVREDPGTRISAIQEDLGTSILTETHKVGNLSLRDPDVSRCGRDFQSILLVNRRRTMVTCGAAPAYLQTSRRKSYAKSLVRKSLSMFL